jgi:hypothetical protein
MTDSGPPIPPDAPPAGTALKARLPIAADVARGVSRLLFAEGFSPLVEFTLPNGRRLDVAGLGADGTMVGVEIKISVQDLKADDKWPDYLPFCDVFYFAVPPLFPQALLPAETGLIVADTYGGAILRPGPRTTSRLAPARRRALMLRFARVGAARLMRLTDPYAP